ncbi:MAG: tetratricopeptide repeat protein [Gammaproteobacteria bacterium]|nr:tetratricopeptide repeat protein [Gammaproteobacteria bacterium]
MTKLQVVGEELSEITDVPIVPPGKKNTENCRVKLGQRFLSGTEIIAPARTTIALRSNHDSEIILNPGCRLVIDTINTAGESYILREGRALFDVVKKNLSFFRVDHQGRFVALVKGTRFSADVNASKLIQFEAEDGRVEIVRFGKIRIDEGNQDIANIHEVETIDSETNRSVSYPLDMTDYLKEFKTYKDAESYYRQQLEQDLSGGDYDRIQTSRLNLGAIMLTIGKPGEALPYFEQGLEAASSKAKGNIVEGKPMYDLWRPGFLNMLGIAYVGLGNYRDGIVYASQAYDVYTIAHPYQEDQHGPLIASIYLNLGMGYGGLGEFRKTINYMERAIAVQLRSDADNKESLAAAYMILAIALNELGYHQSAIETIEKSLVLNQSPLTVVTNRLFLSRAYIGLGDYHRAIVIADKAQDLSKEIGLDQNDVMNAEYYLHLGHAQLGLGDYKLAVQYARKTLELAENYLKGNPMPEDFAEAYDLLGRAYLGLGESQEAIEQYGEALQIQLKNHADERYPKLMQTYNGICEVYLHLRNYQEAVSTCNHSLSVFAKFNPNDIDPKVVAASYSNLGQAYAGLHEYTRSIDLFQNAATILEKYLQAVGKNTKAERSLAEIYENLSNSKTIGSRPSEN